MDGDTGHGGIMAVRRLVRDCIKRRHRRHPHRRSADRGQATHAERRPGGRAARAGDRALPRRSRHEERARSGLRRSWRSATRAMPRMADSTTRCDGCRLTSARQVSIGCSSSRHIPSRRSGRRAQAVSCPLSFMRGKLPRYLSLDEHLALGVTIAWLPSFSHHVIWAALSDFMADFSQRGVAAWEDFSGPPQGPSLHHSRTAA